jgi:exonuclease 3'-5' domain-containing protein 1
VDFLNSLDDAVATNPPPSLYLDLEGDELSKDGTLTLISVLVVSPSSPSTHNGIYILDIQLLAEAAFNTPATSRSSSTAAATTFKLILESPTIPKLFFDVRNDSNALFFHYGIALQGVQDIQLMENASRIDFGFGNHGFRTFLAGLAKCIERDAGLEPPDLAGWKATKSKMAARFDSGRMGSETGTGTGTATTAAVVAPLHVFAERPLDPEALRYCAQDVRLLPRLRSVYWERLTPQWRSKVEKETVQRVRLSQTEAYVPRGRHKARGPW